MTDTFLSKSAPERLADCLAKADPHNPEILYMHGKSELLTSDIQTLIDFNEQRVRLLELNAEMLAALKATENPGGEYYTGLACGIEDRDITDRYEAAEHGWNKAFDYIDSIIGPAIEAAKAEGKS